MMNKEDDYTARLATIDEQLAAAIVQQEQLHALIDTLSRQRRYVAWLLDVTRTRQTIRMLALERDTLEEQMSEILAEDAEDEITEARLGDVRLRLATAEQDLANLLAEPPGNDTGTLPLLE